MPVQLGAAPAHGFDEPLGLLGDCHRRIENFLSILQKVEGSAGEALDQPQRQAVETALTYFRTAAPRHNEDEERSLFPLLRNRSEPLVRQAIEIIDSLEADHAVAAPAHREVDRLYQTWMDAGHLASRDRAKLSLLLDELVQMYQRHIQIEDESIFPLAAQLLNAQQRGRLGNEMAKRRGISGAASLKPNGVSTMSAKHTIDVRSIPGPQRHPLIFQTFEGLAIGEALELINDHDPFPLHNQFNFMKRGQFAWEYLEQGPELWRVKISRIAAQPVKV